MKRPVAIAIILFILGGLTYYFAFTTQPPLVEYERKDELIVLESPVAGSAISSPITITGKARGYWFFEVSFPVSIVDWDGKIIGQYYATAQGDWMTEEFVPFTATFEFEKPEMANDQNYNRGWIILQKDNPSGLPEHDNALEVPIRFK